MGSLMRVMLKVELGPARKFCRVTALRWGGTVGTGLRRRYHVFICTRSVRTGYSPSKLPHFRYNHIHCL